MKYKVMAILAITCMSGFIIGKGEAELRELKITVLYDNYKARPDVTVDWGFACKIEGTSKTILFDTGTRPDILFDNIGKMGVSVDDVELVVISHNHGDHTGGLWRFLEQRPEVTVLVPVSFPADFYTRVEKAGATVKKVSEPVEICPGVWSTGQLGDRIPEQALIIDTPRGLVLITGCAHPGVVNIVRRAREVLDKNIYFLGGGFHLMQHSPEPVRGINTQLKKMGVERCGATHCTGDKSINIFKTEFGDQYVNMGVGRVLVVE